MALYDQPNLTGGIDDGLVEIVTAVPSFIPMLLVFVFGVVFLGGSASQKRRIGYSDLPMWSLMAAVSTMMVALVLSLRDGLITLDVLGIVFAVVAMSALWFFTSKGRTEI